MNKSKTLGYIPYGTGQVAPFDQVFNKSIRADPFDRPDDFKKMDAIIVWGGADISPTIYNEPVSALTYASAKLSHRDEYEVAACKLAIDMGIPIIGICRGAQLACAMAGGKLVQHVDGHGRDHNITTDDGRTIRTSSVHHQMMYPWDVEHNEIAWCSEGRSKVYIGGDDKEMIADKGWTDWSEPEIVYFPKIKALAIQGHPEFMRPDDPFVKYCIELVKKYVLTEQPQALKEETVHGN